MNLALRPYQEDACLALRDYYRRGGRRALVALPTGAGKTHGVIAQVVRLSAKRVLVVAHREELLDQAADSIRLWNPGVSVGIEQADRKAEGCQVIVASVQTLVASNCRRLESLPPADFSAVIVDEAHHATANSYLYVLGHFGLVPDIRGIVSRAKGRKAALLTAVSEGEEGEALGARKEIKGLKKQVEEAFQNFRPGPDVPYLVGVTATPARTDKQGLEAVFDEIVYQKTIREMMEEGYLCPIRAKRVATRTNLQGVHTRLGDFAEGELAAAVNTADRNALIAQSWLEHAADRQTLVFCVDVDHARDMAEAFEAQGIPTGCVVGETPAWQREELLLRYRQGSLRVLTNCQVLTEGFDAPETSCIVMARPTQSQLLYTQMLGRGTRTARGKENLLVLDYVDITRVGVASVHTLFGLPVSSVEVPDVLAFLKEEEEIKLARSREIHLSDRSEDEDADPLADAVAPIGQHLIWVRIPAGYAASLLEGRQIGLVEDLLGHWNVRFKEAYSPAQDLGSYPNAERAAVAAEEWVLGNHPGDYHMLGANQKWRKDPPSEAQLGLARRLGISIPEGITKGALSVLISAKQQAKQQEKPTGRQLWMARKLGLEIPEGASKRDVSILLAKAEREEVYA